ncbi:MAG: hypothetical protein RIC36_04210 [Rhodospirillales bacterium]
MRQASLIITETVIDHKDRLLDCLEHMLEYVAECLPSPAIVERINEMNILVNQCHEVGEIIRAQLFKSLEILCCLLSGHRPVTLAISGKYHE